MAELLLDGKDLLAKTDTFIFDCDGVIWLVINLKLLQYN